MAKAIMVQGTMSGVGKSLITAGLCRVFSQDGHRVAPFKSQNMALNSFVTAEGLELGRAQAMQAEACGIPPCARMNPILLKPVTDMGAQVIVNGEVRANMQAKEYFAYKRQLIPDILRAYSSLCEEYDIVVLEGAGSPAEINLREGDIVNMGMARLAQSPVLLVGDIDRGGVFAQLAGTMQLLEESERSMVKASVINKFRGDSELLQDGLRTIEKITGVPVMGVLPYLRVDIDDEDSFSSRFAKGAGGANADIAVIRLPRISNFTDFTALSAANGGLRYVERASELGAPALLILPGTKSTVSDLLWLRESGLEAAIKALPQSTVILGICGGYQMLGKRIDDPCGAEGGGSVEGMGLLPVYTRFLPQKHRTRVCARVLPVSGALSPLCGETVEGYEIHMGETTLAPQARPLLRLADGTFDGCCDGRVYGCYLHGLFDADVPRAALLRALSKDGGAPGANADALDYASYRQKQYDVLAEAIRENLDMKLLYAILNKGL